MLYERSVGAVLAKASVEGEGPRLQTVKAGLCAVLS